MRRPSLLATLIEAYLHRLPEFRGKWRPLRIAAAWVEGVSVRTREGVLLELAPADTTNRLALTGGLGAVVPRAIEALSPGDAFVDVGANCGYYSLLAARRLGPEGRVLAFEPDPKLHATLLRNLAANGVETVTACRAAVAERSGARLLDVADPHSGLHRIVTAGPGAIEVPAIALGDAPELIERLGTRRTLIKVDVEGFELSALAGLGPLLERPETHAVVVEVNEGFLQRYGASSADLHALLARSGFTAAEAPPARDHYDALFSRA